MRLEKLNRKIQLELNNELHEKQVNSERVSEYFILQSFMQSSLMIQHETWASNMVSIWLS